MFDDGSRIMQDSSAATSQEASTSTSIRGSIPIDAYYEIARVANEAVERLDWTENSFRTRLLDCCANRNNVEELSDNDDDGFICRVALQFPDELLWDASQVTWMMEEAISTAYKAKFHENLNSINEQQVQVAPRIQQHLDSPPLVFILGDSTYGSCCPDEVAAQHLNADVLVHYGYACLTSSSERIPVVYAFGIAEVGLDESDDLGSSKRDDTKGNSWKECVDSVSKQLSDLVHKDVGTSMNELNLNKAPDRNVLLLYDVRYHHAIKDLQLELERIDCVSSVVVGAIPEQQFTMAVTLQSRKGGCCNDTQDYVNSTCCEKQAGAGKAASCSYESCCQSSTQVDHENHESNTTSSHSIEAEATCCKAGGIVESAAESNNTATDTSQLQRVPRSIGGLEIPDDLDLSQHTLLYIGDDLNIDSSDGSHNTRLLHILLRCNAADGCRSMWSYSPKHHNLNCDLPNSPLSPSNPTTISTFLSRTLRRRYFLIQKAKLATTIGILIGTTTTSSSFRRLLSRIRHRIQSTGRTAYTFAVGKLASASSKVSNFAEIDCFVLIACQESIAKFWRMEREEMIVPVITPLELDVALGLREWDGRYSCDFGDLVRWDKEDGVEDCGLDEAGFGSESNKPSAEDEENDDKSDSDDEPFFSMISGKYEHSRAPKHSSPNDLQNLPGQGQLMEYHSEAAEFLKSREYQGLEANVGQTEAKKAVIGKAGIASNYGEEI
jgi:diphthamide biosynthesis protein 2